MTALVKHLPFVSDVAFHFDATAFGQYLKKTICLPKGVKLINSTVKKLIQMMME